MTYILLGDRCHSQRLPSHRIQRAHELGEIDFEKNPASACLGSRNETTLGACSEFFRVHVEKSSGFDEIERSRNPGLGGILLPWRAGRATNYTVQRAMF
jgi:hypothetical protein